MGRRVWALWALAALLCAGVALVSFRYFATAGGRPILGNPLGRPWLLIHIAGAATALLVSPLQLVRRWRARGDLLHRWAGRVYAAGCLVGGAGGLVSAFGSTAGPVAATGFATLGVIWLAATAQGWRLALLGRYAEHRAWMLRSFALTFAAVTLRLYIPLALALHLPFVEAYRAIAWLAWVPNLVVAELYLRRRPRPRGGTPGVRAVVA